MSSGRRTWVKFQPRRGRVLGVERERDEPRESAGLVLQVAQPDEVVHAVLDRLDVPVENRRVRADAEPVCRSMGVSIQMSGVLLAGRDEPAHAVGEDLRAAARERAEPGVTKLAQNLLVGEAVRASSCGGSRSP